MQGACSGVFASATWLRDMAELELLVQRSGMALAVPFFRDVSDDALVSAPAFAFDVNIPWWLASATGFDGQHFLAAHDRRLVASDGLTYQPSRAIGADAMLVRYLAWREARQRATLPHDDGDCLTMAGIP